MKIVNLRPSIFGICVGIVLISYLSLAVPLALHGPYNPDEGWYLYDAWLTWSGHMPYRDFGFPQPPLVLVVHGLFQTLLGPSFYLGRLINVLIGGLAISLAMVISRRAAGLPASLIAGLLLAVSPWFVLQMAAVSTYALGACLLLLTLFFLQRDRWLAVGLTAIACLWTRLPLLPIIPILLLVAALSDSDRWRHVRNLLKGLGLGILLFIVPFVLLAPLRTWLGVAGYHILTRQTLLTPSLHALLPPVINFFKVEYWPRYGAYWLGALLAVISTIWLWPNKPQAKFTIIILSLAVAIALPQSAATNVTYDVLLVPWLAVAIAVGLAYSISQLKTPLTRLLTVSVVGTLIFQTIILPQLPDIQGKGESEESHANIAAIAHYITQHSQATDQILTPELYVALEAQRSSLPGTELGRFFYFPDMSTAEAQLRGVMNQTMLLQAINSRTAVFIVFSNAHHWQNYQAHQDNQQAITQALTKNYQPVDQINTYQPRAEQLVLYERITPELH